MVVTLFWKFVKYFISHYGFNLAVKRICAKRFFFRHQFSTIDIKYVLEKEIKCDNNNNNKSIRENGDSILLFIYLCRKCRRTDKREKNCSK